MLMNRSLADSPQGESLASPRSWHINPHLPGRGVIPLAVASPAAPGPTAGSGFIANNWLGLLPRHGCSDAGSSPGDAPLTPATRGLILHRAVPLIKGKFICQQFPCVKRSAAQALEQGWEQLIELPAALRHRAAILRCSQ